MTIQLIHTDFTAALADLRRIADELRRHHEGVDRSVDILLDGGWSGSSAGAYREGWEEWRAGCGAVLTGLDVLGDLLEGVRVGLVRQDDAVAVALGGAA